MKTANDLDQIMDMLTDAELAEEIENEEAKYAELLERKRLIEYRLTRFKNEAFFRKAGN